MASRSSRRRIKETEVTKLDECQHEDEALEDKNVESGRRRSLRHSPGSSISPPHKTKRIRGSPSDVENKSPKLSPNEHAKSMHKSSGDLVDVLKETEKISPNSRTSTRKSNRNSPVVLNSTPVTRMTRNSSVSPSSPSKLSTNLSPSESPLAPRRSTRRKGNNVINEEDSNNGVNNTKNEHVEVISKDESLDQVKISNIPSTSQSQKRTLPQSPETSITDKSNGTVVKQSTCRSKKAKYEAVLAEAEAQSNGKTCDINSLRNSTEIYDKSENLGTFTSNIKSVDKIINSNAEIIKSEDSNSESFKSSGKRRITESSPELKGSLNKKYKSDEDANLINDSPLSSLSKKDAKSNNSSNSDTIVPATSLEPSTPPNHVSMNTSDNLELLLIDEFNLTKEQFEDVCVLLPSLCKDSSYVAIIEVLVSKLLKESTSISSMSSPRFNKFLRQLLVKYCNSESSVKKKHQLCESALEWSKERKSVNLRHELELALMTLYYDTRFYRKAEEVANALYKETKKLQDKEKTVKACLCLSKAYHAMGNISKARANITTAKTEALKIYTPPDLQAELDLQSGIMQVAEEKDMETAFSYFKEASTGFTIQSQRSKALKYMLLTKLLINRPEEGEKAVRSQCHLGDINEGVEAMLCITKAAMSCSLAEFKNARVKYEKELKEDLVVKGVLDQLYSKMLEKNLLNIIAPYERMQISVVSDKIGLEREEVERRISQMILDGQLSAQLDHRDHCLYVYEHEVKDKVYDHSLDTVSQLDKTLSLLNKRVKQLL